jgi:hypothetical protein
MKGDRTGGQSTGSGITLSAWFAPDAANRSAGLIPERDARFVINAGKSFFPNRKNGERHIKIGSGNHGQRGIIDKYCLFFLKMQAGK